MPVARVSAAFFVRPALEVAPELLGKVIVSQINGERTAGQITEVEAYLGFEDEAAHSFRGPTPRNHSMWLEGGHWYVYSIYGLYTCLNIVCGQTGDGSALLIRSIRPLEGLETMKQRRGVHSKDNPKHLVDGPGKLCQALGVTRKQDGVWSIESQELWIEERDLPKEEIHTSTRIGITKAADKPWRFQYFP